MEKIGRAALSYVITIIPSFHFTSLFATLQWMKLYIFRHGWNFYHFRAIIAFNTQIFTGSTVPTTPPFWIFFQEQGPRNPRMPNFKSRSRSWAISIQLYSQKIGVTWSRPAITPLTRHVWVMLLSLVPERGFTEPFNLTLSFNVPQTDPCCYSNENLEMFEQKWLNTAYKRNIAENLPPNSRFLRADNLMVSLKFALDWPLLPW